MKKYKLIIFIICIAYYQLNAQTPTPEEILRSYSIQPVEPTTSSLGRYGEYQMDYSNGLPDISIPLYEIKSGDLIVPITLRYQGGGIKVQQEATWVGLGWDLFYGGQVTRVVHGFPDEDEPDVSQWPTASQIRDYMDQYKSDMDNSYLKYLAEGKTAGYSFMPDEYYYNAGMESGKFVGEAEKVLIPYKPVKIKGGSTGWSITNSEGITYSFKKNETSTYTAQHVISRYTSAWGVEKITSPHNHTITYEYQTDGNYVPDKASMYQGYYHSYIDISAPWYSESNINHTIPLQKTILGMKIESTKPQYIYFEGGRATFILSPRTDITNNDGSAPIQKLDRILIERIQENGLYEPVKYFQLNYFYRENRLFLSGVDEVSKGESKQVAKFEYDTTPLPDKGSYSYDYCEYYNGSMNITPIPRYNILTRGGEIISFGGANKNVVESYTKAGTLISVVYPTKGRTVFTWENHRYGSAQPIYDRQYTKEESVRVAGSSDITCSDNHPPHKEDNYITFTNYVDQSINVSGLIKLINTTDFQHEKYDWGSITFTDLTSGRVWLSKSLSKYTTISINEVISLQANHTYSVRVMTNCSNVTAYLGFTYNNYDPNTDKYNYPYGGLRIKAITNYDADGKFLDRSKFTYTIPDNPNKSSGYITNTADVLLSKHTKSVGCVYKNPGYLDPDYTNEYTETHLYYDNPTTGIYSNNLSYQYVQVQKLGPDNKNNGITKYEFKTYLDQQLDSELPVISNSSLRGQLLKESIYDSENNLINETTNYYSNHRGVNRSSRGLKVKQGTHISSVGLCPAGHEGIYLLEHLYIPYDYTYYSEWCKMDSTVSTNYYGASPVRQKSEYVYNDLASCRPTQITTALNNGKKKITNITYPPAITKELQFDTKEEKIDNTVIYKQINKYSSTPSVPIGFSFLSLDSVRIKYGTLAEETEVKMKRDAKYNIVELLARSVSPTVFLWSYSGQYPIAEIKNATYQDVETVLGKVLIDRVSTAIMPSEADMKAINDLRKNTAVLKNAHITTYTYKPLVGILTTTDPSGSTITYEYDAFDRLKRANDVDGKTVQEYDYQYNGGISMPPIEPPISPVEPPITEDGAIQFSDIQTNNTTGVATAKISLSKTQTITFKAELFGALPRARIAIPIDGCGATFRIGNQSFSLLGNQNEVKTSEKTITLGAGNHDVVIGLDIMKPNIMGVSASIEIISVNDVKAEIGSNKSISVYMMQ
ncbi:RHS repeat domain-containing protein [Dysgonomonas gadei]|uniref:YD repeat (Two copies) n=1 Tax=Dysgonomonas gadei ATCC BAA-286 TaxID=742766 RepID=F5IXL1_9BACT|nr:RHS repeat domain-containing protein [Dysgonomonas gadei]EGK02194.1 hypothetical protein HMPREF9455_01828 [Dysgonomonas gadei ATCC BAA-286]